ncbi:MAG: YwaF family protein [Oscillospiraceae bacterium]|nr:YwaF family protein [Oscillospiraceae bacterium]
MFNAQHILYMLISGTLTAALLFLANRFVTDDASKNKILKFFAIITVILHYSNLWVDYFTTGGNATVSSNQILPIYPCNVIMWMLLIAALLRNKQRRLFQILGEFCFIVGSVCGTLGIALNFNFDNTPTLADYDILKGMLSHSTMLFGCLYLYFGGYVRIRMFNFVSVIAGLCCFIFCGVAVNELYQHFGMEAPDGMWLHSNPLNVGFPPMVLALIVTSILFAIINLWQMHLPSEDRWYKKIDSRN